MTSEETAMMNSEQDIQEHSHITTLASAQNQENISLPTVPVWLSANGRKIKVNALLNDESSGFYVNDELADGLGLSATYEKIVVTVLSESVEILDSMPVITTLESCNGNVKLLTCPR